MPRYGRGEKRIHSVRRELEHQALGLVSALTRTSRQFKWDAFDNGSTRRRGQLYWLRRMGYLAYDGSSILILTDKGAEALAEWQVTELEIDITTNQQEARHLAESTEFLWEQLSAAKAKLTKPA